MQVPQILTEHANQPDEPIIKTHNDWRLLQGNYYNAIMIQTV